MTTMRVTSVQINNIACFETLSLDFIPENGGEAASWIVLLGENGTGKSTLLQMIGATLLTKEQLSVIAGNMDLRSYVRKRRDKDTDAECTIGIWPEQSDAGYNAPSSASAAHLLLPSKHTYADDLEPQFSDHSVGGWFACGYGTTRKILGKAVNDRGPIPTLDDGEKPYRFASLFGDASGMTNIPDWLAGLYFQTVHAEHTESDVKRYERAKNAILRALPRVSSLKITKERQVIVTEDSMDIPLERLSDGYRGTLAWIGDLIRRLFDAYPDSDNPLKERGVVLIDEIDLHLHPLWQRSVVEDIRKLFPNLQFIVTTHSPFVAQDMRPNDCIIVLEKSKRGPVIAREEPGVIQDWSADQILTSYFGLTRGTRGEAAQRDEARYERLLDAQAQGRLSEAEYKELLKLTAQVDRVPMGLNPDEETFNRVAENVIASLRQRREELEAQKRGTQMNLETFRVGSME